MASKQFSLEPGLSNLNETGKSLNPSVSQASEASRKDLEDLFQDFYDEYFHSSKIMKSPTTNVESSNVEVPSHEKEVFHEISERVQGESSLSSLNYDVQQSPEEVIIPQTNTQLIPINMVPNDDEASTSHNVFNERLEDVYFDATESLRDADWVSAMQEEVDQFARFMIGSLMYVTSSSPDIIFATSESEYVAVSGCCAQVLWMRTQLTDYGFFYDKVPIYCDSKSTIAISCNPVQHTRTKHIDVR
nr:retrovirus-related Pol polyprotein from transposon TNT 1-94 [Tanacetum cinerariifolium]